MLLVSFRMGGLVLLREIRIPSKNGRFIISEVPCLLDMLTLLLQIRRFLFFEIGLPCLFVGAICVPSGFLTSLRCSFNSFDSFINCVSSTRPTTWRLACEQVIDKFTVYLTL